MTPDRPPLRITYIHVSFRKRATYYRWLFAERDLQHRSPSVSLIPGVLKCHVKYLRASPAEMPFAKEPYKKRLYSAKETYNLREPTNRSHPPPALLNHVKYLRASPAEMPFSKLVHRPYKSFPPDRFCQVEMNKTQYTQ